jgi:hypothetical protein
MKWALCIPVVMILNGSVSGSFGQANGTTPTGNEETPLRVNSRAVLVDVLVTDKKGVAVHGLPQSSFIVKEQGKPQTISFFEEHQSAESTELESLALPPNVFSNHPGEAQLRQ